MEGTPAPTSPGSRGDASPKARTPLLSTSTNPSKRHHDTTTSTSYDQAPKTKRPRARNSTFNVTGSYELTCVNRYQPVDTTGFVFNIHLVSNQLWATFRFEKLHGVMRMCPFDALKPMMNGNGEEIERVLCLEDFEGACQLGERVPGTKGKEWLMRWRGREGSHGGPSVGGETRAQGQFNFKQNPKSTSIDGMTFAFGMIYNTKHLIFHGSKISPTSSGIVPTVQSLEQQWNSLFDPAWEDVESDAESNGSFGKKPTDPPTGGVIKAKNKPGPNPGFMPDAQRPTTSISSFAVSPAITAQAPPSAQPAAPVVLQLPKVRVLEERPEWAWPLTGVWEITNTALAKALGLYEPEAEPDDNFLDPVERPPVEPQDPIVLSMTMRMEKPSKHSKGRQLWAQFEFGQWEGCMRFCPSLNSSMVLRCDEFEASCVLKDGIWPGPLPHGVPDWDVRWRAVDLEDGEFSTFELDHQTSISFSKTADGWLEMRGFLVVNDSPVPFEAKKVSEEDVERFGGRRPGWKESLHGCWEHFKPTPCTKNMEGGNERWVWEMKP